MPDAVASRRLHHLAEPCWCARRARLRRARADGGRGTPRPFRLMLWFPERTRVTVGWAGPAPAYDGKIGSLRQPAGW